MRSDVVVLPVGDLRKLHVLLLLAIEVPLSRGRTSCEDADDLLNDQP
jgi:hypothetical protein